MSLRYVALSLLFVALGACNLADDPPISDANSKTSEPCKEGRAVCNDKGECIPDEDSFSCTCDAGYAQDTCDACADGYYNASADGLDCVEGEAPSCDGVNCNNGTCEISDGSALCSCNTDWTGSACDMCVDGKLEFVADSGECVDDMCASDPCASIDNTVDDSCTMPDVAAFECMCEGGYLWVNGACEAQCEDQDTDGYGVGPGCLGPDCNDADKNVFEDNQMTLLSSSVNDSTETDITLLTTDVINVAADSIFTRDPACPTCTAKVMAVYYSPNTNYIPMSRCLIVQDAPLACTAGGSVASGMLQIPTPNQAGKYELRLVVVNDTEADCLAAAAAIKNAVMPDLGAKIADIAVDEGTCVPARTVFTNIKMNGMDTQRYVATPGQEVTFSADFMTAQDGCTGCVRPVGVGMDGSKGGCIYTGVPRQCNGDLYVTSGSSGLFDPSPSTPSTLTAPMAPGIYQVGWKSASVYACDITFGGVSPLNTIAVIVVE